VSFILFLKKIPDRYNDLLIRERVLIAFLMLSFMYFIWYFLFAFSVERKMSLAENKKKGLLYLSENVAPKYSAHEEDVLAKNIFDIEKRMNSVRSKISFVDKEVGRLNDESVGAEDVVLLLRDLLSVDNVLLLNFLKVHPYETIHKKKYNRNSSYGSFKKNVISLKLEGDYAGVLEYLKRVESLKWNVFWQSIHYSVDDYPRAIIEIELYTVSISEERKNNGG